MGITRRELELRVVEYSKRLHRAGWVANHDGNVSVRLDEDRFLITPTAFSKEAVERESLLVVNGRGEKVSGRFRPFSELNLHLYVYRQRPDVQAVLHAHPVTSTGFSVAGVQVLTTMMAEPVVSLGDSIPLVPYARPKSPESTLNLAPYVEQADALLLQKFVVTSTE